MKVIKTYLNKCITIFFMMLFTLTALAQQPEVEMADKFRADGKIYVVIGVFGIVMAVMFIFLFNLDRKIRKLEKEIEN